MQWWWCFIIAKSYLIRQTHSKVNQLLEDNIHVFHLTTSDRASFLYSFATIITAETLEEVNGLLQTALRERDDDTSNGEYVITPRLGNWRTRLQKGLDLMGPDMFATGRRIYKNWIESPSY
jgi:hypothetical protein